MHNNAVWSGGGYVHEIDPEVWDRSMQVALTGVFFGMRAAIPAMLERGGGSIITTSSVDGLFGEIMAAPYATAKAAVLNLTRTVAVEYGRKQIRANCICPGAVETPLLDMLGQLAPAARAAAAEHAIGRACGRTRRERGLFRSVTSRRRSPVRPSWPTAHGRAQRDGLPALRRLSRLVRACLRG
jgi:NAD(P)-dependent dehydrogenase (short-subunit alcohol dehydrogenase family)